MGDGGNLPIGPGFGGFVAFFVMALALWLLVRNMNGRLRRMAYRERDRAGTTPTRSLPTRTDGQTTTDAGRPASETGDDSRVDQDATPGRAPGSADGEADGTADGTGPRA
ncbi:hypothetical protein [Terracoccus luteus]|uniref:Uncharacterized protein n=1 Tax=Terracoccus luteus TaxID=53356 RepID=A0A495XWN4_9MICO|nr:hypothetical protein [Terracoccus luteus]MBB2985628.1 hypothetical protein [Terracoccus luteus]MCP2171280.1 hypothetical protein [Terracoccus luteus]RKT78382.1 hypothetical protein DFJ68_1826 [Terracoccus luteus]